MAIIKQVFIVLIFITLGLSGYTQSTLSNSSFEDEPADATIPHGWFACTAGTTPDILPGYWGVYDDANDGDTFVGLITRSDGSWESIGQRFQTPLEKNTCYKFSIDLANSQGYSGFNKAVKLRAWIGKDKCSRDQMIFESPFVDHEDWNNYIIEFNTEKKAKYLILEAFYSDSKFSHKGNILLDNISPIILCNRV